MAALPLEAPSSSPFVFPHLAQAQGCWTGISLANPGVSPCDVTVEAMNSRGILLGTYAVRLEPGENNAGLINQWIGSTTGLSSGRVEVRFTGPLLAAEIFGSDTLSFIASVPGR